MTLKLESEPIAVDQLMQIGKQQKRAPKEGLLYTLCMLCKIYCPSFKIDENWDEVLVIYLINEITSRVYDEDINEYELEEVLDDKLEEVLYERGERNETV